MNKCTKCLLDKENSCFHKDCSKKSGINPICKECRKQYNKNRAISKKKKYHSSLEVKAKQSERDAIYYKQNKEKIVRRNVNYKKNRKKSDIGFKITEAVRSRVCCFLKNKLNKFSKEIGCSSEQLKKHLESKFQSGMTWENRSEWHIDHVYPLSKAYKEGPEAFAKACHYTNLQPLWAKDNLKKAGNYE